MNKTRLILRLSLYGESIPYSTILSWILPDGLEEFYKSLHKVKRENKIKLLTLRLIELVKESETIWPVPEDITELNYRVHDEFKRNLQVNKRIKKKNLTGMVLNRSESIQIKETKQIDGFAYTNWNNILLFVVK